MIYLDIVQVLEIHKLTVRVSGGGSDGHLDLGKLESVLKQIQNDDYYPTFEEKLTHLIFSTNKFHCFQDGNKRLSISLGAQFLLLNGYLYCSGRFIQEMENISYHVAAGSINKNLLHEIVCSIINEPEFTEQLKLKIYKCVNEN